MTRSASALALLVALAACGAEPAPAPEPSETPVDTGPRTLVATDLDIAALGSKIAGQQGESVESQVMFEGRVIADVVSFVACPASAGKAQSEAVDDACLPGERPDDTVYTYIHRVIPGEGADGPLMAFRTAQPVAGFTNNIGFDKAQAEAALGEDFVIAVEIHNGALEWRVDAGDGWDAGEEITLFWKSTVPPAGASEAYQIDTMEGTSRVTAPFPPEPDADDRPGGERDATDG